MTVKFMVESWRDTAYMESSSDGFGEWNRPRVYRKDMTDDEISEMHNNGSVSGVSNNGDIAIDYDGNISFKDENDIRTYYGCVLMMRTPDNEL